MATNANANARSVRRRTSNRQAAFSFLSSIQLNPPNASSPDETPEAIPEDNTDEQELHGQAASTSNAGHIPDLPPQQDEPNIPANDISLKEDTVEPIAQPRPISEGRRTLSKKDAVATTFLSGISLRGDTAQRDHELDSGAEASSPLKLKDSSTYFAGPSGDGATFEPSTPATDRHLNLPTPVQRSSSTPSLSSSWAQKSKHPLDSISNSKSINSFGTASLGRQRKSSHPDNNSQRLQSNLNDPSSSKNKPSRKESTGILSTLLARDKDRDSASSFGEGSALSLRHSFHRGSSRWLGPLAEHVHIKPLIRSGKARIVKKMFKRPSVTIPKHIHSHSQPSKGQDRSPGARSRHNSANGSIGMRRGLGQDEQRHIFYEGAALGNSCVSLAENLNQHAYMFTTKHGSPLIMSSLLRHNDDRAPNKRRRRRPEMEDSSDYDPYYLDDPELKTGKNRTVISLACYMGSVIQYTRPSDLKRELNEHFRNRHPTIDPSITLSKIRKVKTDILAICEELDLEISTAALAYAYFEKLVLKDCWGGKDTSSVHSTESSPSPVTKENRKMMACACLLLAYKVNEPKRPPGEFTALMKTMNKHMDVSVKDIKENEFQVFSLLDFNLYIARQEFLPHFEQILYRQDYINVQEYLGEDEFYSVTPQARKTAE
ncbi:CDK5 and ABL1 enzyme substrate 1 [Podila epigama]|nr:CDK5 and ABL1 enzyme substrate 1 [Podila epigama]